MAVDWTGFMYAALVSAGGVVGYLKAGMKCHLVGSRAPVRPAGCSGRLSHVSEPQECAGFLRCSGNAGCSDGTEIPQLREVHASWIHDLNQWTHAGEDCFWSIKEKLAFNLSFSRSACQCQFLLSFLQIYSVQQPYHQHKNTNT